MICFEMWFGLESATALDTGKTPSDQNPLNGRESLIVQAFKGVIKAQAINL
ncbi:hypothetical protein GCM10007854_18290 [Algimonas porphyrae]|uniref:Uncharacterized protein n=1 Tax=Algimonas porphyrae TaxID=1128113 RepID=A0ABQ5V128_9PROT|nr:hypothetical protein GCM10007854_18290 [Algimonas porphyrae]